MYVLEYVRQDAPCTTRVARTTLFPGRVPLWAHGRRGCRADRGARETEKEGGDQGSRTAWLARSLACAQPWLPPAYTCPCNVALPRGLCLHCSGRSRSGSSTARRSRQQPSRGGCIGSVAFCFLCVGCGVAPSWACDCVVGCGVDVAVVRWVAVAAGVLAMPCRSQPLVSHTS